MVETAISRRHAVLAFLAPGIDVIAAIVVIALCDDTAASFGFTAHAPLAFCLVRMFGLSVAVASAIVRGRSENESKIAATVEWVYVSALPYAMMILIATPCIVRLVADKPERITARDGLCFWLATGIGAGCVVIESWFVLDRVPALFKSMQRRSEVRRTSSSSTLNVELLDQGDSAQSSSTQSSTNGDSQEGKDKDKEKEEEDEKNSPATIRELLNLVAVDWPLLIQASILLIGAAICEALIPRYVGETVSEIIRADENGTLQARPYKGPVINLLIASAFCGIFSSCRGATFIWLGSRVSSRMRQNLFDSLLSQEIGFFDTTKTGELTSRLTQDCQKTSDQVTLNVNVFLRVIVQLITTLIFMCWLSPALTSVAFISVPAIVVISKKYGRFMQTLSEATQKSLAEANSVAEEGLSTMSTVRMFAGESLETKRFGVKLDVFKSLQQRQARFYISYLAATIWLPQATTALILFYGGKLTMEGNLDSGDLLAFVLYLQSLNGNFSALGDFYTQIVQALGAAKRVFELTRREPKLPLEPPVTAEAPPVTQYGEIRLEDVRFSYPARPEIEVLKGLSLVVPAGKTVALVGPSGNGKSTVIGLVKRLYKAETGRVTLDGVDIWDYPHRALHRCLSIVGQEPVLYARSIKDNITYGLTNAEGESAEANAVPQERIEQATRTANAHDFISAMPQGYDTEVGERGVQLSGGQKQRIAIARALVREPKVLLLDEATSALDAESERQVQQAIDAMITGGGMTVVVIAHRLSTVRNSHKICVIQGGQVVEEGSHDELLKQKKAYFGLVETQLGGLDRSAGEAKSNGAAKTAAESGAAVKEEPPSPDTPSTAAPSTPGGSPAQEQAESNGTAKGAAKSSAPAKTDVSVEERSAVVKEEAESDAVANAD